MEILIREKVGGGLSQKRTRLPCRFPCYTGKYREICSIWAGFREKRWVKHIYYNRLRAEFPTNRNRESYGHIREPYEQNREFQHRNRETSFGFKKVSFALESRSRFSQATAAVLWVLYPFKYCGSAAENRSGVHNA